MNLGSHQGLHNLIGQGLYFSGISHLYKTLFRNSSHCVIFVYHRVCPLAEILSFERELTVTHEAFEKQISYLRKAYTPISLSQLLKSLKGEIILPGNSVVVTFDDGYRDNYDYAFPILKAYDVPATIFLTTGFIENGRFCWWDRLSLILKYAREPNLFLSHNGRKFHLKVKTEQEKKAAYFALADLLLDTEGNSKDTILQEVQFALKAEVPPVPKQNLTWNEIREMSRYRIEFGAHTCSHVRLSRVQDDIVWNELKQSKEIIESHLQKEVIAFAYPYGRESDFDARATEALKRLGYHIAVTGIQGVTSIKEDVFKLRRVPIRGSDCESLFRAKATGMFPYIYSKIRRMLQKSNAG